MLPRSQKNAASEALASCRSAFLAVALFSAIVNVLMLTGSIYMLQVYDRVLPSRSIPTLVALSIIVAALYILLGVFDWLRQRILTRIGAELDRKLGGPVLTAIVQGQVRGAPTGTQPSRDLDSVRSFLSGLGPTALFDLPWMPLYGALCFILHPYLGWTLVAGGVILIALALLTEFASRRPSAELSRTAAERATLIEASRRNAEAVTALGMGGRMGRLFERTNDRHVAANLGAADITNGLGGVSKVIRFMLQSAMLGVGAWLVMHDQASSGVMIAASVLSSRALAPIELAIGSWRPFIGARQAWGRLRTVLTEGPAAPSVAPESPMRRVALEHLAVAPPGSATLTVKDIAFTLEAGQGLAVIGPSASGKSSLARALVGVWPVARGSLRLDGATLEQWPEEQRGAIIGYMPQDVQLFAGTVAENIARFDPAMTDEAVRGAAKAAGAYELILGLPKGFETPIGEAGGTLSGGQRQRIALARALYRDPFLVVLDEPNASLDAEGDAALTAAISGVRARGGIVVVIAHRPSALAGIDLVLIMAEGQAQAFGPKEEVLRKSLAAKPGSAAAVHSNPRIVVAADARG
ncbi:type I secretion system permease/ATPase [Bosea rubneri]|uniref:Type I secretion system permease/ATPase n=1 Tax=Bosea rubneri TaxID=3075434 RepID=A0ABU3SES7_9HYPH|nr:type I secretion system permease/ATPase [Bosea sp. ZW T0_25]MDU0343191.1 type I secretion system permease/ATPase [Bosea sp. ZW T0_25]